MASNRPQPGLHRPYKRKGREGAALNGAEHAGFEAPERVRFARVPQKRKGRGGAVPNGAEHTGFEAPERVRFARVPQKERAAANR